MALETFKWRTQGQPEGTYAHRIHTAQFGDGYKQVAGDGLNPETQSWPLSFSGIEKDMLPILTFMRKHTLSSFIWTPPFGEKGLYRVVADSIRAMPIGGKSMTIAATFEQSSQP